MSCQSDAEFCLAQGLEYLWIRRRTTVLNGQAVRLKGEQCSYCTVALLQSARYFGGQFLTDIEQAQLLGDGALLHGLLPLLLGIASFALRDGALRNRLLSLLLSIESFTLGGGPLRQCFQALLLGVETLSLSSRSLLQGVLTLSLRDQAFALGRCSLLNRPLALRHGYIQLRCQMQSFLVGILPLSM